MPGVLDNVYLGTNKACMDLLSKIGEQAFAPDSRLSPAFVLPDQSPRAVH
jgi:hypothetical protein